MTEPAVPTHFRACCRNVIEVLRKTGVLSPELDARLLISHALDLEGAAYFLEPDRLLSEQELSEIATALARRMAGEPVSRIVGQREFWKHTFRLGPEVLDPRPDSETLIEAALERMASKQRASEGAKILDLGTGSGALLLSLLMEWPGASGVGIDISAKALEIAAENARRLGCADRVVFRPGNWLDDFAEDGSEIFDLVICNPPYIARDEIEDLAPEVALFEPRTALDGGPDGLDPYREIIPGLSRVLGPGGVVIFEIGEGQDRDVLHLLEKAGLSPEGGENGCYRDLSGTVRCVAASAQRNFKRM